MEERPVIWDGTELGKVKLVERGDWKRDDRAPTPLDFERARVAMGAQATYEILERVPRRPGGDDPENAWILDVVGAVTKAAKGRRDSYFEEDVLRNYLDQFGMGQILEQFGGDAARIARLLERFAAEEG